MVILALLIVSAGMAGALLAWSVLTLPGLHVIDDDGAER